MLPPANELAPPTRADRGRGAAAIVRRQVVAARARVRDLRDLPQRLVVAALVLLVAGTATWLLTRPAGPAPQTAADVAAAIQEAQAAQAKAQAAAPSDAATAWATIQPSLVLISVTLAGGSGTGAGVIVKADGTILTANHVVAGARTVTVSYTDGTRTSATVIAAQPADDTATLRPATLPETLVPATLGGGLQVGAPVFAVGHPVGLADSLSAGVVSALGRSVTVPGGRTLKNLIQTDAAVNPGNSGGPLLDRAGHVVGIVTGLANPRGEGAFVGIGFAVPIATAAGPAGSPPQ